MSNYSYFTESYQEDTLIEDFEQPSHIVETKTAASDDLVSGLSEVRNAISSEEIINYLPTYLEQSSDTLVNSSGPVELLQEPSTSHDLVRSLIVQDGILQGWKLTKRISSRVLKIGEAHVLLDCLVDTENKIYEEWEFELSHFEGLDLAIGKTFKLHYYSRPTQVMMEILDNPSLVSKDDFPEIDFVKELSDITLFKRS